MPNTPHVHLYLSPWSKSLVTHGHLNEKGLEHAYDLSTTLLGHPLDTIFAPKQMVIEQAAHTIWLRLGVPVVAEEQLALPDNCSREALEEAAQQHIEFFNRLVDAFGALGVHAPSYLILGYEATLGKVADILNLEWHVVPGEYVTVQYRR